MNLITLMNVINHPDVIPEYMQQDGRTYANPGHEKEVTWIYYKVDGKDWFAAGTSGTQNRSGIVGYNEPMSKRLVVEITDV